MRKRKGIISLSVTLICFILIGLVIVLSLKSCQSHFEYYSDISHYEWIELEFYKGKPAEYLGKYPDDIFCNVYSLKDIAENELLYLDGSGVVGFGSNKYTKIVLNKEVEEPSKRLPIKKITIMESDTSTITIEDTAILRQVESVLQHQTGDTAYSSIDECNASVYFDVRCELTWLCAFEKRNDGSIHLIGYNQKDLEFLDYDVTEILENI